MARILWLLLPLFVVPIILFPGHPITVTYGPVGHFVFVLAAAWLFWSAAVAASSGVDKIYYRISIALFIWSVAVILRVLEAILHQPAYGTIADGFWVVGYLVLVTGAYLWFRSANPSRSRKRWTIVALIAAFTLLFVLFLSPLFEESNRSALLKILDIFYLSVDLMLLGFLSAPASKPGSPGARLMLYGILILMVSDIFFIDVVMIPDAPVYQYLDIPYTVGDFLLAIGAAAQRAFVLSSPRS